MTLKSISNFNRKRGERGISIIKIRVERRSKKLKGGREKNEDDHDDNNDDDNG